MQAPQTLGALADAVGRTVLEDTADEGTAAALRSLLPHATALRLSVPTGDRQVLACVGSLLLPGHLALALHPLSASAAGAAIMRRAPVYLTLEAAEGLACYDFEGSALFCLPIVEPSSPGAQPAHAASCFGALLLSFQAPSQPDALHVANLLLLATALAPRLGGAVVVLLEHCNLILGVDQQQQQRQQLGTGGGIEGRTEASSGLSSERSSGSELYLTDSEVEAEEQRGSQRPEEVEVAPQLGWAAGSCRDRSPEPPEDPGSSATALIVQPHAERQQSKTAKYATATASAVSERRTQRSLDAGSSLAAPKATVATLVQQQGEAGSSSKSSWEMRLLSPSASKARARAEVGLAAVSSSSGSEGEEEAPELLKHSPSESEGGAAVLAQAGATWRHLLRFADPQLERRFKIWHHGQLLQADLLGLSLTASLQMLLLNSSRLLMVPELAPLLLGAGLWPLALLVLLFWNRPAYLCHRDSFLLLLYLACAWSQMCVLHSSTDGLVVALSSAWRQMHLDGMLAPLILFLACQVRLCVQVPLQLLLFMCGMWALPGAWEAGTAGRLPAELPSCCLGFALAVATPLVLLYHLEARSRHRFLDCLPLLPHPA